MGRLSEALAPEPYGGLPGFKEPTTSREAAMAIAPDSALLRQKVLAVIQRRPSTADEVAEELGLSILSVRPRCSELREQDMIRPLRNEKGKQVRRPNASGRQAIVWEKNV